MGPRIWREIAAHDGKQPSAQSPERHKELGSQLTLLQPLKDSGAERDPDEFQHAGGIADHNGWSSASTRREDLAATAEALGLPSTTVRDRLSRYQERAPALGRALVAWAIGQGEEVGRLHADEDRQGVAALCVAWHAWCPRGGRRPQGPWRLLSLITGRGR